MFMGIENNTDSYVMCSCFEYKMPVKDKYLISDFFKFLYTIACCSKNIYVSELNICSRYDGVQPI